MCLARAHISDHVSFSIFEIMRPQLPNWSWDARISLLDEGTIFVTFYSRATWYLWFALRKPREMENGARKVPNVNCNYHRYFNSQRYDTLGLRGKQMRLVIDLKKAVVIHDVKLLISFPHSHPSVCFILVRVVPVFLPKNALKFQRNQTD